MIYDYLKIMGKILLNQDRIIIKIGNINEKEEVFFVYLYNIFDKIFKIKVLFFCLYCI